jgi:ABC-type uncharacterized transport system auxiliary subunit
MKLSTILLLSFLISLTACISQQAVIQKHYTIEYPDYLESEPKDPQQAIPGILEVQQIQIGPVYDRNHIVNRSGSHEITYYKYHQWAVKPSIALMDVTMYYLDKSHLFENISSRYNRAIPDFLFTTSIHQLEVMEAKNQFSAHVHLEFRILRNADNSVLLQHEAERLEPLEEKDLNLFAGAVSEIFYKELEKFAGMIRDQSKVLEE